MTSSQPTALCAGSPVGRESVRRAHRSPEDRILSGVAGGLAEHLGVPTTWVRAFFILASLLGGMGVMLYGGLWLVLPLGAPLGTRSGPDAPGIEAASRQGRRPSRLRTARTDVGSVVALVAMGCGALLLGHVVWQGSFVFWPVVIVLAGVALLWWQADETQRERWIDADGRLSLRRAIVGDGDVASYVRLLVGLGLIATAIVLFGWQSGQPSVARDVVIAGALGFGGIALVLGPWFVRLATELSEEREARVRQQERADVAAHLHDSVLQTLALIQKQAGDGKAVATLARAQERDLRHWLYGDLTAGAETLAAALRAAAAEVEDTHGVPVELVCVGDVPAGERTTALVNAAREAMINAAKHSGAAKVDVYAELGEQRAEVFVRDRGAGFDADQVPEDRLGVRNSIVGRMQRHGGAAEVRASPGNGTEVRLTMQLEES
ncbi:MAG: PspC domain-containing protein [Nocardioidaceae bacterium]